MEAARPALDFRVDVLASLLDGERHALVAVHDEVRMVDAVHEDRIVGGVRLCLADVLQLLAKVRRSRPKAAVELADAAD
jgi:hypothetical protein